MVSSGSFLFPTALPGPGTLGLSVEEGGGDQGMMHSPQVSQIFLLLRTPFTIQVGALCRQLFCSPEMPREFYPGEEGEGWRGFSVTL